MAAQILALADDAPRRAAMGAGARAASALYARDRQIAEHARIIREVVGQC
jgi:hypothetical protein